MRSRSPSGSGATIIDNLATPDAVQVVLQVRFAEVNRNAVKSFSSQITTLNPHKLNDNGDWAGSTNGLIDGSALQGAINLGLFNPNASIEALIRALTSKGEFKSLAEPNLVALPGKEASFLAGGEFPYPSVQGGGGSNAITIVFKEFGIRLHFTPTITRNGSIRLKVAPEVSSLDFSNALVFGGFTIPSLITRRAETEVEMREGQYLAIAGLLDNTFTDNVSKIPLLGDIPDPGPVLPLEGSAAEPNGAAGAGDARSWSVRATTGDQAADRASRTTWKWNGFMALAQGRLQAVRSRREVDGSDQRAAPRDRREWTRITDRSLRASAHLARRPLPRGAAGACWGRSSPGLASRLEISEPFTSISRGRVRADLRQASRSSSSWTWSTTRMLGVKFAQFLADANPATASSRSGPTIFARPARWRRCGPASPTICTSRCAGPAARRHRPGGAVDGRVGRRRAAASRGRCTPSSVPRAAPAPPRWRPTSPSCSGSSPARRRCWWTSTWSWARRR